MDIGTPLTSLFGRIDGKVLGVLAMPNTQLNGRGVHRLLGGEVSIGGVHAALGRLAKTGLVSATPRSVEVVYQANRDHLLWPAVEIALGVPTELRHRIQRFAEAQAPAGTTVVLYGSVQRGEARVDSDVDLVVIFPTTVPQDVRDECVGNLAAQLQIWTGNPAQLIQIDTEGLKSSAQDPHDRLTQLWLTEGEVLVGSLPKFKG